MRQFIPELATNRLIAVAALALITSFPALADRAKVARDLDLTDRGQKIDVIVQFRHGLGDKRHTKVVGAGSTSDITALTAESGPLFDTTIV